MGTTIVLCGGSPQEAWLLKQAYLAYDSVSKVEIILQSNSMELDKLVNRKICEATCDGRIAPKLYSINYDVKHSKASEMQDEGLPDEFGKRIKFIKTEIQTNRSSIAMMKGIMDLLLPIYDEVEELIKSGTPEALQKADEIFMDYMWGEEGKNITWFLFSYLTPEMRDVKWRIEKWAYEMLKNDEIDIEKFKEKRLSFKKELTEAKKDQDNPLYHKKYAHLGIQLPLRKIFKTNQNGRPI